MTLLASYPTDFTGTQGTNGWSYGRLTTALNVSTFTAGSMTYSAGTWSGPGSFGTPFMSAGGIHPSDTGGDGAIRWNNVAYTGNATIHCEVQWNGGGSSNGLILEIFKNSTLIAATVIPGATSPVVTFDVNFATVAGDNLTFAFNNNGSFNSDFTSITALTVSSVAAAGGTIGGGGLNGGLQ